MTSTASSLRSNRGGAKTTARAGVVPVAPSAGRLQPLGLDETQIVGGFWGELTARNREHTIPHILHWLDKAGWIGNFDAAVAGALPDARRGREFSDSEVYKALEAVAWQLAVSPDPTLAVAYDDLVERVAAAQEPDGYLNTNFGRPGQAPRYSDLEWGHELYCYGHLFQAAVARLRTGHDDLLVDVARSAADHVCVAFGPGGLQGVCGHPEIELGLAELGRATGERRYLVQAGLFVDRRGRHTLADIEWGRSYFQDDVPFRTADSLRGHAVRALYLAAGAVDVAVENADDELLSAAIRQWRHAVARRTYITGGMGSRHQDEGFGEDFSLPPDRAYSETCAAVASVMLAWRLLLATGDPTYADLAERTLYNVVAACPDTDGTAFFYTNTLHQRATGNAAGHRRDRAPCVQLDARAMVRGHLLPTQRRPNPCQPRGVSRDEGRVRNPASAVRHMPDQHHSGRRAPAPTRGRDRLPPRRFHSDPVRRPSGRPMDPDPSGPGVGARRHDHRRNRNPVGRPRHHGDHRRVRTRDHCGARSSDDTATELPRPADRRHS